jgi:hypothetical protein
MLRFNIVQGQLNDRGNYGDGSFAGFSANHVVDVRLTDENQVTIEANQDLPHGAELEPIDRSLVGEIHVEKVPRRPPAAKEIK